MRFAIYPKRVLLIEGQTVTPEAPIGFVETDLPVREMLALVQFGTARVEEVLDESEEEDADDSDSESSEGNEHTQQSEGSPKQNKTQDDAMAKPFEKYSAKTQSILAKAGITTLAQAALWLRDNADFTKLGLAKGVAAELAKQITDAGIPTGE